MASDCKAILLCVLAAALAGCSFGRPHKAHEQAEANYPPGAAAAVSACGAASLPAARREINTVFVHPGLLLSNFDWDQSLAVKSAKTLVANGYAKDFVELRDRDMARVGALMREGSGTRFLGVHYSMGGKPSYLQETLASVERARRDSGKPLAYYPLLVDPFGIDAAGLARVLDADYLGQVFIVLSGDFSFLRPRVDDLPEAVLNHPKVHLIYAEDLGENWGHFGALHSLPYAGSKFREVFLLMARTVTEGLAPSVFAEHLALLKIQFAGQDARPVNAAWLELAQALPCAKG